MRCPGKVIFREGPIFNDTEDRSEDCSCRYLTSQMLERPSVAGGHLEVSEVEIEGWARSCGETPLQYTVRQSPFTSMAR